MRKTLNINLGGLAFIIDENAFELLHNYLEALKQKFNNEAERAEIMNDIESRIAEMLNQKLAGRKEVLSIDDVQSVMDIMGRPEDIAGEETADETKSSASSASSSASTTTMPHHKKLFRDTDDAKVGGVISGLCHYFGINDPVWARIAALILIIPTSGSIILLYLLLIIIVPKAVTAADKLQMKGEPININTIEKEIKDAAGRATDSVHKFVHEQNFFERLWDIIVSLFMVFWKVIAGIVVVIGLIILFVLVLGLFGVSVAGTAMITQAPHLLTDSPSSVKLFSIGLLLLIGSPVVAVIYGALRLIFLDNKSKGAPWLKWALLALFWTGVIMVGISVWRTGMDFRSTGVKKEQYGLMQPSGNLYVQLTDSSGNKLTGDEEETRGFYFGPNGLYINGTDVNEIDLVEIGRPVLQLMPSANDSFYMEESISSQGKTKAEAMKNAEKVIYNFNQKDSILNLPYMVYLDKNNKWRCQRMTVRIAIPEGKKIHFSDNIDRWEATVKGDGNYDDTHFANTVWTVENGKVKCVSGENHEKDEEKTGALNKYGIKGKKDNEDDDSKDDKDSDY